MVKVNGVLLNPAEIASAEIETRHYMNGSASWLVITLNSGRQFRWEHHPPFNAFSELQHLEEALRHA